MGTYYKVCNDYCNDMREKQKHLLGQNVTHQKRVTSPSASMIAWHLRGMLWINLVVTIAGMFAHSSSKAFRSSGRGSIVHLLDETFLKQASQRRRGSFSQPAGSIFYTSRNTGCFNRQQLLPLWISAMDLVTCSLKPWNIYKTMSLGFSFVG